jgi:tRNA(fMet)-specific endonuclease VapC
MIYGYLLDTNIFEYWLNEDCKEHAAVINHLAKLPATAPLTTSLIVLGEVSYGFQLAAKEYQAHSKEVLDFIKTEFPRPLAICHTTTQIYGKLRAALFDKYAPKKNRKGLRPEQLIDPATSQSLGIQENDLWIASQALEHNLILVTNDQMKQLRSVAADLQVENWTVD